VLPCVPIWAAIASGWITRWRRGAAAAAAAAAVLLALPLTHSLLLAAGIADDTRREAAQWLAEHGPAPPYRIAYFGYLPYQLEAERLPGVTMTMLANAMSSEQKRAALDGAAVLTFSELDHRRYQDFPGVSGSQLDARERMRAEFPIEMVFRRPFWLKAGFHNPDIELRLRGGVEGHRPGPGTIEGERTP